MLVEGPALAALLRHIAERPPAVRAEAEGATPTGVARPRAVIADLYARLGRSATPALLDAMTARERSPAERNRLAWVLAAAHALDGAVQTGALPSAAGLDRFFTEELAQLAATIHVDRLDADEERREELARRSLRAVGMRPAGESATEAEDRLKQVDSIERARLLAEAAERERRAREVREAMAKKAAEEAVPKVGRE
jgi:hypothetical protein